MLLGAVRRHVGRVGGHDRAWLAILAACLALNLAASWQRWANPVVDVGREMNQPLRLAAGEMLYSDVRHIYGPLSPWLHAIPFRIFNPSLTVLYADGIVTATMVLALKYWLGRQIMSPAAAGAATLTVMSFCVFKPAGNYILSGPLTTRCTEGCSVWSRSSSWSRPPAESSPRRLPHHRRATYPILEIV